MFNNITPNNSNTPWEPYSFFEKIFHKNIIHNLSALREETRSEIHIIKKKLSDVEILLVNKKNYDPDIVFLMNEIKKIKESLHKVTSKGVDD